MLGQDLVDACVARGHEVFALSRADLDVTDADHCEEALADVRPNVLINCAAWTDVDGAEADEAGAMLVNDTGASQVASACARHGATIVHISSDYVFDGSKQRPYVESDMPEALSAYGRSKQAGETSVAVSNPRHIIVRSAWLFGASCRILSAAQAPPVAEPPEMHRCLRRGRADARLTPARRRLAMCREDADESDESRFAELDRRVAHRRSGVEHLSPRTETGGGVGSSLRCRAGTGTERAAAVPAVAIL